MLLSGALIRTGAVAAHMAVATSRGTAGMALAPMAITKDLKWHTKNMTL